MNAAALALFAVYLTVGFVVRTVIQYRRTGDTGWRGISGRPGKPEWWAGVLFVAAFIAGVLGPVAAMAGLDPIDVFVTTAAQSVATAVAILGTVVTYLAQLEMGTNWRIGVQEHERTDLVTSGPFTLVRNPVFSAMAVTGLGLAFMVPNVVALTGFVLLIVALQLQVRVVEEPYLRRTHGDAYARYEQTVGRFFPAVGLRNDRADVSAASRVEVTAPHR